MCSGTSVLGVASSLMEYSGNAGCHCICGCYSRCYSFRQVRNSCPVVVDCFGVCTYVLRSDQLCYCCGEKHLVVRIAPLAVLELGSLLSIDSNEFLDWHYSFSRPLSATPCSFVLVNVHKWLRFGRVFWDGRDSSFSLLISAACKLSFCCSIALRLLSPRKGYIREDPIEALLCEELIPCHLSTFWLF